MPFLDPDETYARMLQCCRCGPAEGKVYFLDAGHGVVKIGHTRRSVELRRGQVETEYGGRFRLAGFFDTPSPKVIEAVLHERLKSVRIMRELFKVQPDLIDAIQPISHVCGHVNGVAAPSLEYVVGKLTAIARGRVMLTTSPWEYAQLLRGNASEIEFPSDCLSLGVYSVLDVGSTLELRSFGESGLTVTIVGFEEVPIRLGTQVIGRIDRSTLAELPRDEADDELEPDACCADEEQPDELAATAV